MAPLLQTPGVYEQTPAPDPAAPLPRTDVAGFVGFERRLRDSATRPTTLLGTPAVGHRFAVDVSHLRVTLDGRQVDIPRTDDFVVSQHDHEIPIAPGGSLAYLLVAIANPSGVRVAAMRGKPAQDARAVAPTPDQVARALGDTAVWTVLGGLAVRRETGGDRVHARILAGPSPVVCEDLQTFEDTLGQVDEGDDTLLGRTVRAYFTNGGRRCHVALVSRPAARDPVGLRAAAEEIVGTAGDGRDRATGLERLLLVTEVAMVDTPDLYARHVQPSATTRTIPAVASAASFGRCAPAANLAVASGYGTPHAPLFSDDVVEDLQRRMLVRCAATHWRVLLLLTAPVEFDVATGRFGGPSSRRASRWRQRLDGIVDPQAASCAAFYFPWVLVQDDFSAPTLELPPNGFALGIIAARDHERGPHIAPANEVARGLVGLTHPVDDALNGELYAAPLHINCMRALGRRGIRLWGARTLSGDTQLRHVAVRRCLSAIERKVAAAFEALVFEPNRPTLWMQMTQTVLSVLLPAFEAGALRGDSPSEAFWIRCDATNNPPEQLELGRVVCEVGVAIAVPAEFIVFRLVRGDEGTAIAEVVA